MKPRAHKTLASLFAGTALIAAIGFTMGFQQGQEKVATVDFARVIQESTAGVKAGTALQGRAASMEGLVKYFEANDVMTPEQATRIKDLSLLEKPSDADKRQLDQLQADVKASMTAWNALIEKKSPTQDELNTLSKMNKQRNDMSDFITKLKEDLRKSFAKYQNDKNTEVFTAAKAAVKATAVKKGFTMVLDQTAVVFSVNETANDITADSIKAVGG